MIIMAVIMTCYNVSFYALLYPNSEFSWQQMEKIAMTGYWMLFGELNLDGDTSKKIFNLKIVFNISICSQIIHATFFSSKCVVTLTALKVM